MATDHDNANSFNSAADVYERARPSYPAAAVDWLLESRPTTALDLGAGTGKFTRLIVDRVETVYAVDPGERMLAQLSAISPTVTTLVGTAERIPLPEASVDAVFSAQAWHWVDPERALPEIERVLTPGGTLGLIWNVRDERVPWVKRLTTVMHNSKAELYVQDPQLPHAFERREWEWTRPFDRASLLELVASRSYFITADERTKAKTIADVENLLDTDPDIDWVLPYRTVAFRIRIL